VVISPIWYLASVQLIASEGGVGVTVGKGVGAGDGDDEGAQLITPKTTTRIAVIAGSNLFILYLFCTRMTIPKQVSDTAR